MQLILHLFKSGFTQHKHARSSHNSTGEDSVLSVYDAVSMGPQFATSRMIAIPSYLGPKVQ